MTSTTRFALAFFAASVSTVPALAQSGPIIAWGNNQFGQATPPPGNFVRVSASPVLGMGIREDGSLAAWGVGTSGQLNVPSGTFQQVSAGSAWGLALRTDGTLAAWGRNDNGQVTGLPSGVFAQIAAANRHGLALRPDGTLLMWGEGLGTHPGGTFREVRGGTNFSLGLRTDGTLAGWGDNQWGQTNVPSGTFVSVAAGDSFGAAVTTEGTLRSWGGILGGSIPMPTPPSGNDFVRVSGGLGSLAIAMRSNGSLVAWGFDGPSGELNVPPGSFIDVAAGAGFGLAIVPAPGVVWCMVLPALLMSRRGPRRDGCS